MALPPLRNTSAPASAATGWGATIMPLFNVVMLLNISRRQTLGHKDSLYRLIVGIKTPRSALFCLFLFCLFIEAK
jgi:hypothetical protein